MLVSLDSEGPAPSLTEGLESTAVVAGDYVEFTCVFDGQPSVTWFHNEEQIEPDYRVCVSEDTSSGEGELRTTLTIRKSVPDDCGSYTCTVEGCPFITSTAELVVKGEV